MVDADSQIIVAAADTDCAAAWDLIALAGAAGNIGSAGQVLADAGYCSEDNVAVRRGGDRDGLI